MQFEVKNIDWNVEDKEVLEFLPSAIIVDETELNISDLDNSIRDYITETYGVCPKYFEYYRYEPKGKTIEGDYFLVVEEWNYPTESGKEPCEHTFDNLEEALNYAHLTILDEVDNFRDNTNSDVLNPDMFDDNSGYILTTKNGLDDFYYAVRIIGVKKLS